MKCLLLACVLFSSLSAFGKISCENEGNTELPVRVEVNRSLLRKIKSVKASYEKTSEVIACNTTKGVTVCTANKESSIGKVIFHPIFGASYTIKSQGETAQWLRCK